MLVVQSRLKPARIRNSLVDLVRLGVNDLHVAAAYVTLAGSNKLFEIVRDEIGITQFDAIPKVLVTSVDFGVTEPAALSAWMALPNTEVWIAGVTRLLAGSFPWTTRAPPC